MASRLGALKHYLLKSINHQWFSYYINITFPERVIVENIIPRNVIINRGAAEVDNHIIVCFLLDLPW